ncbi:xylulokinase [Pseudacidovorax intermedius]|uniref:Xylulose kinase n=1 Tax=Pseudacidovorax intermedius TaxID=433924 RepID=A0A147GR71_9BURK|nr:xylulokinase [Pseudacidovorax intermedius]KTT18036.1 xylulose kinase [Pseudacidovorax intermedius]
MYLGLDLGTSELKALLLADDHRIVATAGARLELGRPQPLWAEQAPAQWADALHTVMAQLQATQAEALAQVRAIGLSGQMHGAVLLDADGQVLRPAILWNDGRSAAQCTALTQAVPALAQITGNLAMPGFTAPKLLWVREHEPALFARTARVLLPKDWLRFVLSGEAVSDMSDAAGTLWLDVARRDWSDTMLAATGLTRAHMPRLVEGSAVSAWLDPALARRWGLGTAHGGRVAIAGGGGDNAASAVGMGIVRPGQGFVSLGTSGVIFIAGAAFAPRPERAVHAFCHALPGRWHQMSVMLSAASAVSWAARAFGLGDEAALLAQAATLDEDARARAPLFLPYLSGERSPHNDPHAQGVLFGLGAGHGPADIAYAVVEGVSLGLRDGLDTLVPPDDALALVGGGARSLWWAQLLSDVLEVPLTLAEGGEAGGALGAARLAWLADGGDEAHVCVPPPVRQRFEPRAERSPGHRARQARFRALYEAVRPLFAA